MSRDEKVDALAFRIVDGAARSLNREEIRAFNRMSTYEGEKEAFFAACHALAAEILARPGNKRRSAQWISRTRH